MKEHDAKRADGMELVALVDDDTRGAAQSAAGRPQAPHQGKPWLLTVKLCASGVLMFVLGVLAGGRPDRAEPLRAIIGVPAAADGGMTPPHTGAPARSREQVSYSYVYSPQGIMIYEKMMACASAEGMARMLQQGERLMAQHDAFRDSCHPLLHRLGRAMCKQRGMPQAFDGLLAFSDTELSKVRAVSCRGAPDLVGTHTKSSLAESKERQKSQHAFSLQNETLRARGLLEMSVPGAGQRI